MRYWFSVALALLLLPLLGAAEPDWRCAPTRPDVEGPFYRPGAPLRNSVGSGYLLFGEVKSARDCRPIAGARIEIWLVGPDGRYDERWRATVQARADGRYYFSSHVPPPYGSRPPHLHLIVNAPGFAELITQYYPAPGTGMALFDLILLPQP